MAAAVCFSDSSLVREADWSCSFSAIGVERSKSICVVDAGRVEYGCKTLEAIVGALILSNEIDDFTLVSDPGSPLSLMCCAGMKPLPSQM